MTKRELLGNTIRSMLIIALFAFVFVLFRSLSGPSLTSQSIVVFDDVQVGETAMRRAFGARVWATRLGSLQRTQLAELNELVVNPNSGCSLQSEVCVLSAKTQRDGIDIVFSTAHPVQLAARITWYGGFIDPTNGAVYDRLGRAYKSLRQTNRKDSLEVLR